MYMANCSCGKGLIVIRSPVAILGKQFVVVLFGKGFIVALLDKCSLLGILAVLALSAVHAFFGKLAVLALDNVHAFSNILAKPNLKVFVLLVVAWCNMVVIASCKQQQENLIVVWESYCSSLAFVCYCHCSLQYDNKK
jgi:hypothetical protein